MPLLERSGKTLHNGRLGIGSLNAKYPALCIDQSCRANRTQRTVCQGSVPAVDDRTLTLSLLQFFGNRKMDLVIPIRLRNGPLPVRPLRLPSRCL